jgi:hypothetical protein
MQWLKKLFSGQQDHNDPALELEDSQLESASLQELILANIELGRQVDVLQARRVVIRQRMDALHDLRDAPVKEST